MHLWTVLNRHSLQRRRHRRCPVVLLYLLLLLLLLLQQQLLLLLLLLQGLGLRSPRQCWRRASLKMRRHL